MEISDLYLIAGIRLEESRHQYERFRFVNLFVNLKVQRFLDSITYYLLDFGSIHDQTRFC